MASRIRYISQTHLHHGGEPEHEVVPHPGDVPEALVKHHWVEVFGAVSVGILVYWVY